jgi:hypothetical protein
LKKPVPDRLILLADLPVAAKIDLHNRAAIEPERLTPDITHLPDNDQDGNHQGDGDGKLENDKPIPDKIAEVSRLSFDDKLVF